MKWYNKHCSQDLAPFCTELLLFEVAQFLNKWLSHCCWDPCWKGTWISPSELYHCVVTWCCRPKAGEFPVNTWNLYPTCNYRSKDKWSYFIHWYLEMLCTANVSWFLTLFKCSSPSGGVVWPKRLTQLRMEMEHELREEIAVNLNSVISLVQPIEEFFKVFWGKSSSTNIVLCA